MTKKASQDQLEELHAEFAGYLKTYLGKAKKIMDKAGEDEEIQPNASTLKVIQGFLKDNGIELHPLHGGGGKSEVESLLDGLEGTLPYETAQFQGKH